MLAKNGRTLEVDGYMCRCVCVCVCILWRRSRAHLSIRKSQLCIGLNSSPPIYYLCDFGQIASICVLCFPHLKNWEKIGFTVIITYMTESFLYSVVCVCSFFRAIPHLSPLPPTPDIINCSWAGHSVTLSSVCLVPTTVVYPMQWTFNAHLAYSSCSIHICWINEQVLNCMW